MLNPLVIKGYLEREKFGPIWLYKPVVAHSEIIAREIDSFVDNVLDKSIAPIYLHFVNKKVCRTEIEELK